MFCSFRHVQKVAVAFCCLSSCTVPIPIDTKLITLIIEVTVMWEMLNLPRRPFHSQTHHTPTTAYKIEHILDSLPSEFRN